MVVATVSEELPRLPPRPASKSADRWNGVHQGQQLRDVVAVAAGEGDLQRDPVRVDDQVVLGAGPTTVDRAGSDVVPPLRARTWEPSTAHRSRSSAPPARNWASNS